MYKTIEGKHGTRYLKDGRFVKKTDIPADILIKLGVGMTDINEQAIGSNEHKCIFCGMATKEFRLLNSQPVYVCEEHYLTKTLGEIAQKERENG